AGMVRLQIPEIELDLPLSFESLPLRLVSQMLQRRQVAYRLMVIERATDKEFLLPTYLSGEEVGIIAFVYRAIVDRSFVWPAGVVRIFVQAIPAALDSLAPYDRPAYRKIGPTPMSKSILGHSLPLGPETIIMQDGIIQNADEVQRELARGNGHPVK